MHSDQLEHGRVWVQAADMLQEWDRIWQTLPHPNTSHGVGAPLLVINPRGLGCPKEAGGTVPGLHHDYLLSTAMLHFSWAHPKQTCRC